MVSVSDAEAVRQASLKYLWMHNRDWIQMAEEGEPQIIVEGHGVKVIDGEGRTFIDVKGGYWSVNVGYGRTEIADAAYEQMVKTAHFPSGATTVPTIKLAQKLADMTPGTLSRVFPVSGGSEANETALKIAWAYHQRKGEPDRYKIISRVGSYHGTTGAAIWLGGHAGAPRHDFEPSYPGMLYAPQPLAYRCEWGCETASQCAVHCAQAIEDLILFHRPETVAAVIAEPVAAPFGAAVPGDEYWPMLRETCDKYGVLLIADEVITGFGRTGKMFAMEHWGVVPDIMTVAKGIVSSYLPMAATIATTEVADVFAGSDNFFKHVLTFSGHPAASAAALKNIEIMESENLVENAANVGAYFKEQFEGLKEDHPVIGDVRGIGLMNSLELVSDRETKARFSPDAAVANRLNEKFRKNGLILRADGDHLISIAPPLCVTRSEADEIVNAIDLSLGELEGELGLAK